jgi:hypothetical protein
MAKRKTAAERAAQAQIDRAVAIVDCIDGAARQIIVACAFGELLRETNPCFNEADFRAAVEIRKDKV